jgi:hypothetical protein
MTHHHIRWSGGLLNWEPFSTRAEAEAGANQELLPAETYTIEQYDDETCPRCPKRMKPTYARISSKEESA